MALKFNVDVSDFKRLEQSINRIGQLPKKTVVKAAGKGATIVGKAIRANAPKGETGQLKKGFKRKKERSKIASKAVYDYAMDSAKNDIFQKPIKNPGVLGGKHKGGWGYYPNSVEYGFLARAKGGGIAYHSIGRSLGSTDIKAAVESSNTFRVTGFTRHRIKAVETVKGWQSQHIEGQHFVRRAAEQAEPQVEKTIIDTMVTELEKEWAQK